jgi:hypothetical protein
MTVAHAPCLTSMAATKNTRMIRPLALASLVVFALFGTSCDKHSFESTKRLHESYNPHGHSSADAHAEKADAHAPKSEEKKH